jgi:hypothetical protein
MRNFCQEKWEEASKDIKESKKPAVESGEEGQQKEKLQISLKYSNFIFYTSSYSYN